ncbi:MAG: hypothetical protein A2X34_02995 [Elusimicrobia bacterium GWC2_51_8]|nr:MAG: hypothetical protein A2X33_07565 [Elusimicrobia bacterium GWA2_51_34]OGR59586.1 MAG: hypothetical protein A2X34_02995 [Elusimicrobia bacterium GWC2_51_8]OGR85799.1 MAG: hypothetical protein A2021_00235 [Elusimicrobia bacterium GWF2_52_66]
MREIKFFFDRHQCFALKNIKPLAGICGLYFIFLEKTDIQYPFGKSRLIYIGMSEKKTNSIGKRLSDHYDGISGNQGLVNYRSVEQLNFTYLNFAMLKDLWSYSIEDLESYFILDFVEKFGVYPICNNKTGFEVQKRDIDLRLLIDWKYFDKKEISNDRKS